VSPHGREREVRAVASCEQRQSGRSEHLPQRIEIIGALRRAQAAHPNAGAFRVGHTLRRVRLQLLKHGRQRRNAVPRKRRRRRARNTARFGATGATLIKGDDIADGPQPIEQRNRHTGHGTRRSISRPTGKKDDR
jgi:hypothetical protein